MCLALPKHYGYGGGEQVSIVPALQDLKTRGEQQIISRPK